MENRLAKLEKQLRNQLWLNRFLMAGIVIMVLGAYQNSPVNVEPVVKAEKFELVNAAGKTILVMESRETAAEIALYNNDGKRLLTLGSEVKGEGALMQLNNRQGGNILQFRSNEEGAAIKLYDDNRNGIVYIGEDKLNDRAGIITLSENDKQHIILNAHEQSVYLANPKSKTGFTQLPPPENPPAPDGKTKK
ncbi:MAG TPA: hypothetical protein PK239_08360 [Chitinophagales bacterium]|nr:hypothetical protein [Chitinophagales bacterium]HRK27287.1 hypothetical protein [Chitinophagales bacterium]